MSEYLVIESVVDAVNTMSKMEVINKLGLKPGIVWESYDEMLANADFDTLRKRVVVSMFKENFESDEADLLIEEFQAQ